MNIPKPFEVEIAKEKYYVLVTGIEFTKPKSLENLINRINSIKREYDVSITLVNPKILATKIHGILAAKYAIKSFKYKLNVSRRLDLEILVYIAANRQIKEAIRLAGPEDRFSFTVFIAVSKDTKSLNKVLEIFLKEERGTLNDSILRITKEKFHYIRNVFSIRDEELRVTLAKDEEEALTKCVLTRLTIFHIKK